MKNVTPNIPWAVFPVSGDVMYRRVDTSTWEPTNEFFGGNISFEPFTIDKDNHEPISDPQ
jgi:hypothetical protein